MRKKSGPNEKEVLLGLREALLGFFLLLVLEEFKIQSGGGSKILHYKLQPRSMYGGYQIRGEKCQKKRNFSHGRRPHPRKRRKKKEYNRID